jgi:hypothetical protein
MRPIQIEVIAPVWEGYNLCSTCELLFHEADLDGGPMERGLEEYPADWIQDYQRLSDWLADLSARYGGRILIRVIDPQSVEGFFKCLRHWVRRYPTFLVDGRKELTGWNRQALEAALQARLGAS